MKLTTKGTNAKLLAVSLPALALVLLAGSAYGQLVPVFDHLKCYVIKDPLTVKHTLDLTPEQHPPFLPEPGCVLKAPAKLFCIDVNKSNVQPTPGGVQVAAEDARDYLCYIVHCPTPNPNQNLVVPVEDQFGVRAITIKPPKLLCAPAHKQGFPPKPTPTPCVPPGNPTPTITPTPRPCGQPDAAGQCGGDCPDPTNQKCLDVPGGTPPCQCQPNDTMCMNRAPAGQPLSCQGLCPGVPPANGSQCGQDTSGTSCVCLP